MAQVCSRVNQPFAHQTGSSCRLFRLILGECTAEPCQPELRRLRPCPRNQRLPKRTPSTEDNRRQRCMPSRSPYIAQQYTKSPRRSRPRQRMAQASVACNARHLSPCNVRPPKPSGERRNPRRLLPPCTEERRRLDSRAYRRAYTFQTAHSRCQPCMSLEPVLPMR
jgi:hypothetical protein